MEIMKKLDILYFYIVVGVFTLILGYYFSDYLYQDSSNIITNINLANEKVNPGIIYFFKNNILFFIFLTIIPFINLYYFNVQFFSVGSSIHRIINLPINSQFEILYRHLIFEIIAIIISIIISYEFWNLSRYLLKDEKVNWKKEFIKITILYSIIIICTFIGAVLEGSVNVANQ